MRIPLTYTDSKDEEVENEQESPKNKQEIPEDHSVSQDTPPAE